MSLTSDRVVTSARLTSAWEILRGEPEYADPELRAGWERLARESHSPRAVFHSPAHFDHLRATAPDQRPVLAVARCPEDGVQAVVPLIAGQFTFRLQIWGTWSLDIPLRVVRVPGGHPDLLPQPRHYAGLFRAAETAFPDCAGIVFELVPRHDLLAEYLDDPLALGERYLVMTPVAARTSHHSLPLPASFADYLGRFRKKQRYNLNRQVRLFGEHCGPIDLRRMERAAEFERFFGAVADPGPAPCRSDAIRYGAEYLMRLRDLAARDLLRGYVLWHGAIPVASMLGYKFGDTYLLESIRFDAGYARMSPGAVLLHLVVDDLIATKAVSVVDFSDGNPAYRYHSSQRLVHYASVLVLRKNIRNRAIFAGDRALRSLKLALRGTAGGRRDPGSR
jgi:CelD/BcsL family acetyltransferase involved in cellulose biosynthesis